MIINEDSGFSIKNPSLLDWYGEVKLNKLKAIEQSSNLKLKVPEEFKETRKDNTIYKVGFLRAFLKKLYPEKSYQDIVGIMNERYQLFLGKRQVERYVKEYEGNKKYH